MTQARGMVSAMMDVQARLAELKREYQLGEAQLRDITRRETALRETMLRITGAIQVLEELLSTSPEAARPAAAPAAPAGPGPADPAAPGPADENGDRSQRAVLTVP